MAVEVTISQATASKTYKIRQFVGLENEQKITTIACSFYERRLKKVHQNCEVLFIS